ncbi:MAG: Ig-like domain-containing protein [Candidatus Hodarchaeota archaeon]
MNIKIRCMLTILRGDYLKVKVMNWIIRLVASLSRRKWAKQRPSKILLLFVTSFIVLSIPGFPFTPVIALREGKLTASDVDASDYFGNSVAISGDTAVVGAPYAYGKNRYGGAAYVFVRIEIYWVEQAKLTASDGDSGDCFGWSVAISGGTVVVGARYADAIDTASGAVYVYVRNGTSWREQAKLDASDGSKYDRFGESVAISEDEATVVVGAPYETEQCENAGAVYVFRRDGTSWREQAKLTASDAGAEEYFGSSVAISGAIAVVGAPYDKKEGQNVGSAYVFAWDGTAAAWREQAKLTASDAGNAHFGVSVAISGATVIIGAAVDDQFGYNAGAVYVFGRDGTSWREQAKLIASDSRAYDKFGWSVAMSENGTTMAVGAPYDKEKENVGKAYVFTWDGTAAAWSEQAKLTASDGAEGDLFGSSVAISGGTAVVGAYCADPHGSLSGAAYGFVFEPPVAEDVAVTGEEDMPLVWTPAVSDPDSEVLSCTIVTPPAHGSAWVAVNGSEGTYTPIPDYYGTDSFTYEVSDGFTTNTGTVTVQVNPVNDVPLAEAGGPYSGATGVPLTFDASRSGDIEGDPLQYRWDFDGDGTWDTAYSPEPTATHTYMEAYAGEVVVEVYDGSNTSTAQSTATIIAPITVTVGEVSAKVALFSYTLVILFVTILTGALMGLHRKRKHQSAN